MKKIMDKISGIFIPVTNMDRSELHPDRAELFYYGKMIDDLSELDSGIEFIQIVNQS
jgi:hypothetical protein